MWLWTAARVAAFCTLAATFSASRAAAAAPAADDGDTSAAPGSGEDAATIISDAHSSVTQQQTCMLTGLPPAHPSADNVTQRYYPHAFEEGAMQCCSGCRAQRVALDYVSLTLYDIVEGYVRKQRSAATDEGFQVRFDDSFILRVMKRVLRGQSYCSFMNDYPRCMMYATQLNIEFACSPEFSRYATIRSRSLGANGRTTVNGDVNICRSWVDDFYDACSSMKMFGMTTLKDTLAGHEDPALRYFSNAMGGYGEVDTEANQITYLVDDDPNSTQCYGSNIAALSEAPSVQPPALWCCDSMPRLEQCENYTQYTSFADAGVLNSKAVPALVSLGICPNTTASML